jgi:O-antigen ligase
MVITFVYFQNRKRLRVGLLTLLLIVAASVMIISKLPVVKERFLEVFGVNKTSDWVYGDPQRNQPIPDARLVKWQSALDVIRDNWLFGVGSGDVQDELNKQYEAHDFQAGITEQFNTHNQFLQTWVGTGLMGLAVFIATLIVSVAKAIRLKNHFFLLFMALFVICCLTESMLERQFGILFYVIFSSLFYQRKTENSEFVI